MGIDDELFLLSRYTMSNPYINIVVSCFGVLTEYVVLGSSLSPPLLFLLVRNTLGSGRDRRKSQVFGSRDKSFDCRLS